MLTSLPCPPCGAPNTFRRPHRLSTQPSGEEIYREYVEKAKRNSVPETPPKSTRPLKNITPQQTRRQQTLKTPSRKGSADREREEVASTEVDRGNSTTPQPSSQWAEGARHRSANPSANFYRDLDIFPVQGAPPQRYQQWYCKHTVARYGCRCCNPTPKVRKYEEAPQENWMCFAILLLIVVILLNIVVFLWPYLPSRDRDSSCCGAADSRLV